MPTYTAAKDAAANPRVQSPSSGILRLRLVFWRLRATAGTAQADRTEVRRLSTATSLTDTPESLNSRSPAPSSLLDQSTGAGSNLVGSSMLVFATGNVVGGYKFPDGYWRPPRPWAAILRLEGELFTAKIITTANNPMNQSAAWDEGDEVRPNRSLRRRPRRRGLYFYRNSAKPSELVGTLANNGKDNFWCAEVPVRRSKPYGYAGPRRPNWLDPETQIVTPDGIPSAEAFGTPQINQTVTPTGIASAEAFGDLSVGGVVASPTGIPSAEAFGTLQVNLQVGPSSIASAEAFGTPSIGLAISPAGIASAEAFGLLRVGAALAFFLPPLDYTNYPPYARLGTHSPRFRALHWTKVGKTVTINGVEYRGGYWAGPLSSAEVAAIIAAGYGSRIVGVFNPSELPSGLD